MKTLSKCDAVEVETCVLSRACLLIMIEEHWDVCECILILIWRKIKFFYIKGEKENKYIETEKSLCQTNFVISCVFFICSYWSHVTFLVDKVGILLSQLYIIVYNLN